MAWLLTALSRCRKRRPMLVLVLPACGRAGRLRRRELRVRMAVAVSCAMAGLTVAAVLEDGATCRSVRCMGANMLMALLLLMVLCYRGYGV